MAISADTIKDFEKYNLQIENINERKENKAFLDWTGFEGFGAQKRSFVPTSYTPVKEEVLAAVLTVQPQIENIIEKVKDLEEKVSILDKSVLYMEKTEIFEIAPTEISIEVTEEEAKEQILKLFEEKGELDYIEIVSTLDLDLKLVVEICEELEKEKKIGVVK